MLNLVQERGLDSRFVQFYDGYIAAATGSLQNHTAPPDRRWPIGFCFRSRARCCADCGPSSAAATVASDQAAPSPFERDSHGLFVAFIWLSLAWALH